MKKSIRKKRIALALSLTASMLLFSITGCGKQQPNSRLQSTNQVENAIKEQMKKEDGSTAKEVIVKVLGDNNIAIAASENTQYGYYIMGVEIPGTGIYLLENLFFIRTVKLCYCPYQFFRYEKILHFRNFYCEDVVTFICFNLVIRSIVSIN